MLVDYRVGYRDKQKFCGEMSRRSDIRENTLVTCYRKFDYVVALNLFRFINMLSA